MWSGEEALGEFIAESLEGRFATFDELMPTRKSSRRYFLNTSKTGVMGTPSR